MRKVTLLFVVVILFTRIMSFTGCSTTPKIHQNYMVEYDSQNPYNGTWLWIKINSIEKAVKTDRLLIINGDEGAYYYPETKMIFFQSMRKGDSVIINEGFKQRWVLSDNDNTLRAISDSGSVNVTYKRIQSLK